MLDLAQGVRQQIIKETAPKTVAPRRFTMRTLRRMTVWGGGAAGALLLAVLSSRNDVVAQRLASAFEATHPSSRLPPVGDTTSNFDAQAETQRLADAVRGLAAQGEEMKSRLAAVEHDMDGVTGSVTKEIEAAAAAHRAEDGPTVASTASVSATMTPNAATPLPGNFAAPATIQARMIGGVPAPPEIAYGVDIASGLTLEDLRKRWAAIRNAHPQLFAGLEPIASVREAVHGNTRLELRLVVGPLAEAGDAAQLCTSLAALGLFCQPAMFDGQRLALR
jgi:hypothetical protein